VRAKPSPPPSSRPRRDSGVTSQPTLFRVERNLASSCSGATWFVNGTIFLTSSAGFGTLFLEDENIYSGMHVGKSVVHGDVLSLFRILQIASAGNDQWVVSGNVPN